MNFEFSVRWNLLLNFMHSRIMIYLAINKTIKRKESKKVLLQMQISWEQIHCGIKFGIIRHDYYLVPDEGNERLWEQKSFGWKVWTTELILLYLYGINLRSLWVIFRKCGVVFSDLDLQSNICLPIWANMVTQEM